MTTPLDGTRNHALGTQDAPAMVPERPLSWPGMQCVRCSKKADLEVLVGEIYEARCKGHKENK
jgi:hypothetical protein